MTKILCILGGGRSSRFGGPKLWLRIQNRPVLSYLLERLAPDFDQCWLSVAPGRPLPPGAGRFDRILFDRSAYAGPLPAMAQVLSLAPRRAIVIFAAGDMPLMSPQHIEVMVNAQGQRRLTAVMSRWCSGEDAGRVEPLPSVWRAGRGAAMLRRAMTAGVRGPHRLASWRGVMCVPIGGRGHRRAFTNLNRAEDAAALGAVLPPRA